jgi:hypothetical protein
MPTWLITVDMREGPMKSPQLLQNFSRLKAGETTPDFITHLVKGWIKLENNKHVALKDFLLQKKNWATVKDKFLERLIAVIVELRPGHPENLIASADDATDAEKALAEALLNRLPLAC